MMHKKFTAKSIQAAISKVKNAMGSEAMIISTRRIQQNLRNPYPQDLFEVTAAAHQSMANARAHITLEKKEGKAARDAHRRLPPLAMGDDPDAGDPQSVQHLKSELVAIKDMLFLLGQNRPMPDVLQIRPECLNWYVKIVKSGFPEKKAQLIIQNALGSHQAGEASGAETLSQKIAKALIGGINVMDPFTNDNGEKRIAAFVGPTGVGKTTTIAKLAAVLGLSQQKKVGLISVDGFRIGAVEQLKTYAAIMGFPCLPAFNREDLLLAINKLRNNDILLIDTAGHSHLDNNRMQALEEILSHDLKMSTHLVLSAGMNHLDMREVAQRFTAFKPETYVFTKLDETKYCGSIISHAQDMGTPISFMTNGQRVPEDILPATRRNILEYLLNN
jgi:flagellar biosynthesis protein FlhF